MEFGFTEEQEKLRQEVHDFLMNELPEDYNPHLFGPENQGEELINFKQEVHNKLVEKGWPHAGWPKKYGGLGYTANEQGMVGQEMAYWGVGVRGMLGYMLVGPVILVLGTEAQKERFIPPIIKGEEIWLECFTEPEAGSDEANVKLRAVPDGDDFVLNGQKIFITHFGEKPDWLYTLARTEDTIPPHRGISLILVPADAPGVSYRPMPTMGGSTQNQVFYDDVRVPKENLLGQMNQGFYAAMATLEFERGGMGGGLPIRRSMERWIQFCREEKRNGKPLIEDPQVRKMLAWMAIRRQVQYLNGWYSAWRGTQREKLGFQPYDLGILYNKQWSGPSSEEHMDMFGLYGQLKAQSKYAKYDGSVESAWEASRSFHAAGTMEILKMVVATRGLGLPRIPRQFNAKINEALSKGKG